MGALQAREMASMADLHTALVWHLTSNHYPPVPLSMLDVCKRAIALANDGEYDLLMSLPDGVSYKGLHEAPVWAIVEQHHLDAFIDNGEADDLSEPVYTERGGHLTVLCPECERAFDLTDEADADEWYSGHDCEVQ